MKNISTLIILTIVGFQVLTAQTKIEADERMDGVWSNSTEKWELINQNNSNTTSYFEFSEDFSFLTHKTESNISIYKLTLKNYNSEHNHYNFIAISDSGNEYNMIVDYEKRRIRFIYKDNKENMRLVQHRIKDLAYVD